MTCLHIITSDEGTTYCSLAEKQAKDFQALQAKLDIAVKALEELRRQTDTSPEGELMKWWDHLRYNVLTLKDASFPREMFEGLMDDINERATETLSIINKPDS